MKSQFLKRLQVSIKGVYECIQFEAFEFLLIICGVGDFSNIVWENF
jgi:hypothetical protein